MDVEERIKEMTSNESETSPLVKLRGYLITGLLVIGPIFITLWLTIKLFLFADGVLGRPIQYLLADVLKIPFFEKQMVHGIGIIALLALIVAAGWLARQYLGGRLVRWVNRVMDRVPLINKVYSAILQISEALLGGQKEVFKYAVIIEYPKENVFSIGFVTQDTRGSVQESISDDVISVFVPTTPNPTSGYLLFVPKNDATFLDLSVEEALKLIISAGAVVPRAGGGSHEAAKRLGIRIAPARTDN